MLMSSMMGAIAFQKDLGAVHSCAHALSTVADLHHGLANGVMIDHVMRFNLPAATGKMASSPAWRGSPAATMSEAGAGAAFVDWLSRLKADLGIPGTLSALRLARPVTRADIPALVEVGSTTPAIAPIRGPARAPISSVCSRTRCERDAAMLKVGISACFFHEDPKRPIFKGMTLQYIEQNVAHWLMQRDVLAFMVPSPEGRTRRPAARRRSPPTPRSSTRWCSWRSTSARVVRRDGAAPGMERRPDSATITRSRCSTPSWTSTSRCSVCAAARR